jgi:chromosome transmission fidelity protein 18
MKKNSIICVCNDAFAAALRPLKQFAKVVTFHAPTRSALVERLSVIAKREGVSTDNRTLTALCELHGNDIRACVNT